MFMNGYYGEGTRQSAFGSIDNSIHSRLIVGMRIICKLIYPVMTIRGTLPTGVF